MTDHARTYSYGALPPADADRAIIDYQFAQAHTYFNNLVEIERGRRDRETEALLALDHPKALKLAEIDSKIKRLTEQLKAAHKDEKRAREKRGFAAHKSGDPKLKAGVLTPTKESRERQKRLRNERRPLFESRKRILSELRKSDEWKFGRVGAQLPQELFDELDPERVEKRKKKEEKRKQRAEERAAKKAGKPKKEKKRPRPGKTPRRSNPNKIKYMFLTLDDRITLSATRGEEKVNPYRLVVNPTSPDQEMTTRVDGKKTEPPTGDYIDKLIPWPDDIQRRWERTLLDTPGVVDIGRYAFQGTVCLVIFVERSEDVPPKQRIDAWASKQTKIKRRERVDAGFVTDGYQDVEERAKDMQQGAPPKFRSGAQNFTYAVGVTRTNAKKQPTVDDILNQRFSWAQIQLYDRPNADPETKRGRRIKHGTLWLKIDHRRHNAHHGWVAIPFVYHRPLPDGASVQRVFVRRERKGTHHKWSVNFVLTRIPATHRPKAADTASSGSVGIDLNWRKKLDGTLRVAVWTGSDGCDGEIALSANWHSRLGKPDAISGARDEHFDDVRHDFADWFKQLKQYWESERSAEEMPRCLKNAPGNCSASQSPERFSIDVGFLAHKGFKAPQRIREWKVKEDHLHEYEDNARRNLLAHRFDFYRVLAAELARRYHTVVFEGMDLQGFHEEKPLDEATTDQDKRMKKNLRPAATSTLRRVFRERFASARTVPAAGTTASCNNCGAWNDAGGEMYVTCGTCGTVYDRDLNASRNILCASGPAVTFTRPALDPQEVRISADTSANRDVGRAARRRRSKRDELLST